jgi:hypothetical protein
MKLEDVREVAKRLEIKVGKLKKAELIRQIQQTENNEPCFGTESAGNCRQHGCLWREDCLRKPGDVC